MSESKKRKVFDAVIKGPIRLFSKVLPGRIRKEIFASKIINSDQKLNLKSSMVAIQKISEDEREWDWYADF